MAVHIIFIYLHSATLITDSTYSMFFANVTLHQIANMHFIIELDFLNLDSDCQISVLASVIS